MTHPGSGERASAAVSAVNDAAAAAGASDAVNDAAAAVSAVAAAAAGASDGHTFARRFGDPRPSERRLGGLHVALPDGPFEGLDIRPWTAETVGVVDVDLRAGTVIDWAALQAALPYGPFRAEAQLDPGPPWFSVVAVRAGVVASDVSPSDAAPACAPSDAPPVDTDPTGAAEAGSSANAGAAETARADAAPSGSGSSAGPRSDGPGSVLLLVEVRGEVVSAIILRRDPATA